MQIKEEIDAYEPEYVKMNEYGAKLTEGQEDDPQYMLLKQVRHRDSAARAHGARRPSSPVRWPHPRAGRFLHTSVGASSHGARCSMAHASVSLTLLRQASPFLCTCHPLIAFCARLVPRSVHRASAHGIMCERNAEIRRECCALGIEVLRGARLVSALLCSRLAGRAYTG